MFRKLNSNLQEFISIISDNKIIDWSEGRITQYYSDVRDDNYVSLFIITQFNEGTNMYILESLRGFLFEGDKHPILARLSILPKILKSDGTNEAILELQFWNTSQLPEDTEPDLFIRAKEFNIYEVEPVKNESGEKIYNPTLIDFLKLQEDVSKNIERSKNITLNINKRN